MPLGIQHRLQYKENVSTGRRIIMRIVLMVILIVASIAVQSVPAAESESGSAPQAQRVILKWLGTAGWEIQFAQTKILIDPFLMRREAVGAEEWKTDEEAVLNVISGADYIFAGPQPRRPYRRHPFYRQTLWGQSDRLENHNQSPLERGRR